MGRLRSVEELFAGRHFDREVGHTVDFRLSMTRDVAAAKAFFKKAIRQEGRPPHTITLDGYAASHRAVREMREGGPLPRRTNCGLPST
jgi:transposase-like protein